MNTLHTPAREWTDELRGCSDEDGRAGQALMHASPASRRRDEKRRRAVAPRRSAAAVERSRVRIPIRIRSVPGARAIALSCCCDPLCARRACQLLLDAKLSSAQCSLRLQLAPPRDGDCMLALHACGAQRRRRRALHCSALLREEGASRSPVASPVVGRCCCAWLSPALVSLFLCSYRTGCCLRAGAGAAFLVVSTLEAI